MNYSKEFEVFWTLYPKRWDPERHEWIKRRKCPAWIMWQRLTDTERHEVLTKVKFIKKQEGKYPRDAATWLNPKTQRGWEDIEPPANWVPRLPKELTDVCEAPEDDLNMGTRRTALIRQLRKA
jgi:hypothetical protein